MPSIGNGDKNWAPSKNTRSMSGLTNSGRPGSGKNRFRLGARITLPLVAEFCYLFNNWVCFAVDLLLRILAAGSTPKRRRQNHRIPPVAIRLNLLREKKKSSLSLQKN